MVVISRWGHSRFWAVHKDGRFICITVYLRGAKALAEELGDPHPIIDKL